MQLSEINNELNKVLELLYIEKKADFDRFREHILKLTLKEKREKGFTWHPVAVKKEGFTFGDRAFMILEKTNQFKEPHRFKSGTPIEIFSTADAKTVDSKQRRINGIIQYLKRDQMKVVLNTKDIPNWVHY